jgi:hypothetical protein
LKETLGTGMLVSNVQIRTVLVRHSKSVLSQSQKYECTSASPAPINSEQVGIQRILEPWSRLTEITTHGGDCLPLLRSQFLNLMAADIG